MFFDSSSAPLKTNRWHAFAHFFLSRHYFESQGCRAAQQIRNGGVAAQKRGHDGGATQKYQENKAYVSIWIHAERHL